MILPASLSGRAIVEGVDLSQYQQGVDYRAVVASGKRFGFVRVADGDSHPDPTFFTHRDGLLDAGAVVGPYLFFRAGSDAKIKLQIELLSGATELCTLPPVIDAEVRSDLGFPREVVQKQLLRLIAEINERCGRCLVYTAAGWWETFMGPQEVQADLWVAHYGVERPLIPRSWHGAGPRFWQHTGEGSCPGIKGRVDLNVFYGGSSDFEAYVEGVCR